VGGSHHTGAVHSLAIHSANLNGVLPEAFWAPTLVEIEGVARVLAETSRNHWVRQGTEWVFAAKTEFGSAAPKLDEEFAILAREVKSVLVERSTLDGALRAAAFYHLRFVGIHPLFDGKGS